MKFKIIVLGISLLILVLGVKTIVSSMKIETIILCSLGKGGIYISSNICKYFLYKKRNTASDISELGKGAGISFILGVNDSNDKYEITEFLLENGMDINAISHYSGLTALHDAVLLNDIDAVRFLVSHNASLDIKPSSINMNPLEFTMYLKKKNPLVDRKEIFEILSAKNSYFH